MIKALSFLLLSYTYTIIRLRLLFLNYSIVRKQTYSRCTAINARYCCNTEKRFKLN